jgi:hypothetical protein
MRLDTRKVVNVVIMKDFNLACHDVQIQIIEVRGRLEVDPIFAKVFSSSSADGGFSAGLQFTPSQKYF